MSTIIPIASQEKFDSISPNRSNGQAINLELQFRDGDHLHNRLKHHHHHHQQYLSDSSTDTIAPGNGSGGGGGSSRSSTVTGRIGRGDSNGVENPPAELHKTALCVALLVVVFVANLLSIASIHDRTPVTKEDANQSHPPLRDITYDVACALAPSIVHNALYLVVASEVVVLATTAYFVAAVLLLHPHKSLVLRRYAFLLALLFALRLFTMNATMLPVSSVTVYHCVPKERSLVVGVIASRFFDMVSDAGLSVDGDLRYCGNYVFSGHTVLLVLNCLMVDEYCSRRPIFSWSMRLLSAMCAVALVAAGFDYTISIITAYYATTRLFWIYHTMANNTPLKRYDRVNQVCKEWWYPIFRYLEGNVRNVVLPQNSTKF